MGAKPTPRFPLHLEHGIRSIPIAKKACEAGQQPGIRVGGELSPGEKLTDRGEKLTKGITGLQKGSDKRTLGLEGFDPDILFPAS